MKIGAILEAFRLDFRCSVETAAVLGISGLQAHAVRGELTPESMTEDKIREVLDIVKSCGLVFSALCGDFGHGFTDPEWNRTYIEKSKRILDLSLKLECGIVTTHIGKVPEEECETKEIMRKACRELAEYADSVGAFFAVETGAEHGKTLRGFLDSLGAGGVKVNFDPANLVMCACDRPENALQYLGEYIVHTHAKDGIMLNDASPSDGRRYRELPLGMGDVDFDIYLPALSATGYDGFLTIERTVGSDPVEDIGLAVSFLREKLSKHGLF